MPKLIFSLILVKLVNDQIFTIYFYKTKIMLN